MLNTWNTHNTIKNTLKSDVNNKTKLSTLCYLLNISRQRKIYLTII